MPSDILIVDDEADIRDIVSGILSDEGHGTRTAKNAEEALDAIEARRPHLVFLDIWLQGSHLDGLQLLQLVKTAHPSIADRHDFRSRQYRNRRLGDQNGRL